MDLPDVIREEICSYVLTCNVSETEPWITISNDIDRPRGQPASCLAILATCRQLLLESFHIYYSQNMLNFKSASDLYGFMTSVSYARRAEIISVRCSFSLASKGLARERVTLRRLPRLRKLAFILPVSDGEPWNHCRTAFAKFSGVSEVTIIQDGTPSTWPISVREKYIKQLTKPRPPGEHRLPPIVDLFARLKTRKAKAPALERKARRKAEKEAEMDIKVRMEASQSKRQSLYSFEGENSHIKVILQLLKHLLGY